MRQGECGNRARGPLYAQASRANVQRALCTSMRIGLTVQRTGDRALYVHENRPDRAEVPLDVRIKMHGLLLPALP